MKWVIIGFLLFLSSCTSWHHPTKTEKDFERDKWLCEQRARQDYRIIPLGIFSRISTKPNEDDVEKCLQYIYGWEKK